MNNCISLIENTSQNIIKYCKNECNSSIINECFCKCIYEKYYNNNNNDNDNTYTYSYVLYESTILSYVLFSILLFMICVCISICACKHRLNEKNNNEKYNLLISEPPTYDSAILDLD